jgi:hypothetical protein
MGRNILAALAGYVAIGILVVATDQIFSWVIPGFRAMAMPPFFYFAISLLTDFIYSAVGGYVCSALARNAKTATLILVAAGEIIGLSVSFGLRDVIPHFFALGLLLLYPLGVLLGSRLRRRKAAATAQSAQPLL